MSQIIISTNVVVPGGPKFASNEKLEVQAYDLIEVTVPKNTDATSAVETLLPGSVGAGQLLAIKSDWYGDDLKYALESGGTDFTLDRPLILAGTGAVAFFVNSTGAPSSLFFTNASGNDAKVQILIGRHAVKP
jgi:hypothetical protein